ncbi:aldose 1-epimerase family protein [Leifsonia sp. H3M29-4]|uniref:aldose 1-epimerase family protein n=1 Tax=Salinibacterium metalliresistens TaxID=3031321 RepID=UPI0023DB4D83|nr:aldose 1-epimerase family protein [Salinibacterium metalliresistens]MDF1478266.1 aldose 1-epimerase family protein [Salinibacterium metalliresistens]
MKAPTGEQHVITRGTARAVITELAASLRELSVDGVDLVQSYPEHSLPPFGEGIVLMPWPNRVEDGRWQLDGAVQQLDLTEVERNNAIHGLLRNTPYRLVERDAESVVLAADVFPQHGYPFHLETTVRYALVAQGIEVTHGVRNVGSGRAPVAVGTHPFLKIGGVPTDELTLVLNAATHFEVDARLNPIREHDVEGTEWDLRAGRLVRDLELDDAFGGVSTVGGVSALLRAPDGREVRLLQDERHGYLQAFITREFPGAGTAIALEPMTAPANAFNSGLGLQWLEPGAAWAVGWGIQYHGGIEGE